MIPRGDEPERGKLLLNANQYERAGKLTLSEMEDLLAGSRKITGTTEDSETKYDFITAVLKQQGYSKLGKRECGVLSGFWRRSQRSAERSDSIARAVDRPANDRTEACLQTLPPIRFAMVCLAARCGRFMSIVKTCCGLEHTTEVWADMTERVLLALQQRTGCSATVSSRFWKTGTAICG